MIDFGEHQPEAERMRVLTDDMLVQQPLSDDNRLLDTLQQAHYLEPDTCVGYAPAALYFTREGGEDDRVAELFVGRPLGEAALVPNGDVVANYSSTHFKLLELYDKLPFGTTSTETGTVTDCQDGRRLFVPRNEQSVESQILHGRFAGATALRTEFDRLGIDDIGFSRPWVTDKYQWSKLLSFIGALREAAKWVSYTLEPPYDHAAQERYPRTLTFEEATVCLDGALSAIADGFPAHDIDFVHDILGYAH